MRLSLHIPKPWRKPAAACEAPAPQIAAENLGAATEAKAPAVDRAAQARAKLEALHLLPSGYAPRAAVACEKAFVEACREHPGDTDASLGLLQILRERAAHEVAFWPAQKRHLAKLQRRALTQFGVVLRAPHHPDVVALLGHADDLFGAGGALQTEILLQQDVLGALGDALVARPKSRTLSVAVLRALGRLAILQPWSLPTLMAHLERWAHDADSSSEELQLLPIIIEAALKAPLGLKARVVTFVTGLVDDHTAEPMALLSCCQMLRSVLLPAAPHGVLGRDALRLVQRCATLLPGEAPSYEGLRIVLECAEHDDAAPVAQSASSALQPGADCGTDASLAVAALDAADAILGAVAQSSAEPMMRSMALRSCIRLEQTAPTEVARRATQLLAQTPSHHLVKAQLVV